eukprot:TRINITY_DN17735_c0_g1_i1.p2 TRINITY_DN17735_c0_g1~~TRINITY_DN17735_c0_g1_i1.p2  ORF type:complete len:145 (+),score=33.19 TRINITY_DN17735_c0_g1_i1:49-483(+)
MQELENVPRSSYHRKSSPPPLAPPRPTHERQPEPVFPFFRRLFGRIIGVGPKGERIVGFAFYQDGSYRYACLEPHGRDPLCVGFLDTVKDPFARLLYLYCIEFRADPRCREVGEVLQNWPEKHADLLESRVQQYRADRTWCVVM